MLKNSINKKNNSAEFIFRTFHLTDEKLTFHFEFHHNNDEIYFFNPSWYFPKIPPDRFKKQYSAIKIAAFSLGMTELVSYWKAGLATKIKIMAGVLSEQQKQFFKKLYINGLGEFLFKNKLDTPEFEFLNMNTDEDAPVFSDFDLPHNSLLVPIGGGKDSAVTLEILKKSPDFKITCFEINPRKAALDCVASCGGTENLIVKREISPELIRLNSLGFYNGHTPSSALVAFSGLFFSLAYGFSHIVLSNESGANEGNIDGVNHQYSKSFEFEKDFREYVSFIFKHNPPNYFSLLRGWSEFHIMSEFMKHPKYLPIFQSCNVGTKTDSWCGECAKCLYVAVMLSAHLQDEEVDKIIKGSSYILDNPKFLTLMNGLCSPDEMKPFECVGTKKDVTLSIITAKKLRENISAPIPFLLQNANIDLPVEPETFDDENFIPIGFLGLLNPQ